MIETNSRGIMKHPSQKFRIGYEYQVCGKKIRIKRGKGSILDPEAAPQNHIFLINNHVFATKIEEEKIKYCIIRFFGVIVYLKAVCTISGALLFALLV